MQDMGGDDEISHWGLRVFGTQVCILIYFSCWLTRGLKLNNLFPISRFYAEKFTRFSFPRAPELQTFAVFLWK